MIARSNGKRHDRPSDYEEPYFWATGAGFYKGKYPPWFDVSESPVAKLLEDNYQAIRDEVMGFYETQGSTLEPNWLPYGYKTEGWLTADLYSFGMRTKQNCDRFPFLDSLVSSIPGMMLAQVAVLRPGTVVRPHIGETSAVIRCHLPLVVPGTYPDLGMRVGGETRCWKEGEVFALNIAYRHRAWNLTDKPRVVVVVDTINPDYADRQHEIEAGALAWLAMKGVANAFKPLKRAPVWVTKPTHVVVAGGFRSLLWIQRRFAIDWTAITAWRPAGRRRRLRAESA